MANNDASKRGYGMHHAHHAIQQRREHPVRAKIRSTVESAKLHP
jgi:hypothetical protein